MDNTSTRYAQFNALTVSGRIFHAEIVNYNDSEFLSVSVISTASKNGTDLVYTFTNNNGLLSLHKKDMFNKGRQVTLVGHIQDVSQVYTTKAGEVKLRTRPEVHLTGVTLLDGGLGALPKEQVEARRIAPGTVITQVGTPAVDATPSMEPVEIEEEELVAPY